MKLGPFLGICNTLSAHALERTEGGAPISYLLDALDVNVDNSGRLEARPGTTKQTTLTNGHSLFCDGTTMYLVSGGQLCKVVGGTLVPLASVVGPVSYALCAFDLYFSDGTTLRRIRNDIVETPSALPSPTGTLPHEDGAVARSARFQTLMPAGDILAFHAGRLLSAQGNLLTYSEPFFFDRTDPLGNTLMFPEAISLVVPCGAGVYVVADRTYWIVGLGTPEMQMSEARPERGIKGTSGRDDADERVWWVSENGLVLADGQGQTKAVHAEAFASEVAATGASVKMFTPDRIVVSLPGSALSGKEHADYVEMKLA